MFCTKLGSWKTSIVPSVPRSPALWLLEEDVSLGLLSSDMSQMAKQRSYSSKSSLVGPLSLSELPKEYEWPKGSCVTHHNRVGAHENLFVSWSSRLHLWKFSPKPHS